MQDRGHVETLERGDTLVLELVDEIDIANVGHIRHELSRAALTEKPRIIVSLQRTSFIDVRGIDMLIEFLSWVHDKSVAIVTGDNPTLRKVIDLTRLADLALVVDADADLEDDWLQPSAGTIRANFNGSSTAL